MADVHICDECGKRLATMGGLEIHMAMSHGAPPAPPHDEPEALDRSGLVDADDDQPAMAKAQWPPAVPAAATARPPRPPRKPFLGGIDPAEPLAWVLTIMLFLGSVAAAIHHPHPPSDVTTVVHASSSSAAPADATTNIDQQNQLAGVDLAVGDLDPVWTLQGSKAITGGDLQQLDGCLSPPVTDPLVGARYQSVDYKHGGGELDITSTLSSTSQVATQRLAAAASPQYLQCEIRGEEQRWVSEGATLNGTTVSPLNVSLPVAGHSYQFVTRFTRGGVAHSWTTDDFQLTVGRIKTHLIFGHCACTPFDVQADIAIVNLVAGKLQHLAVRA